MTPQEFLAVMFGHESLAGLYLTIWDRQTKKTASFQLPDVHGAAINAEARGDHQDVYVCTCPFVSAPENTSRGAEADAGALVATWLDIDIVGPAHKGNKRPAPALEAALDLLKRGPTPPTVVVNSGYGLHVWWALETPWLLKTPADRVEAKKVSEAWVSIYNRLANERGFDCDSVGDLARVLRIPGTQNHKLAGVEPKNVAVHAF